MLTKKERNALLREHTGTFEDFPRDLELKEVFGDYPAVKKLTITFNSFVKEDVQRAMKLNKGVLQAILTVHSKLHELNEELLGVALDDQGGQVDESAMVDAKDVREKILLLIDNVVGSAKLALDAHAGLRSSVSNKVMTCIGAKHLAVAPSDKEKDDFMSESVAEAILERAELKESVRIATNANKGVFGTPSTKQSWGGGGNKSGKRLSKGFNTPPQPKKPTSSGGSKGGKGGGGRGRGGKGGGGKGRDGRGSGGTETATPPE